MITEIIKISDMTCSHCVKSIEDAIKSLPVEKYEVQVGSLYVEYDSEKIKKEQIINAIQDSGYEIISNN